MKKVIGALTGGSMIWVVWFSGHVLELQNVTYAWVADRDAECVVALDQDLREVEAWVVPRPTALVLVDEGVLVKGSGELTGEVWWLLERGARPARCSAPERDRKIQLEPDPVPTSVQGSPTAWVQAGPALLVATPGAVHLFSADGELERVQGGFRWISDIALSGQTSP